MPLIETLQDDFTATTVDKPKVPIRSTTQGHGGWTSRAM